MTLTKDDILLERQSPLAYKAQPGHDNILSCAKYCVSAVKATITCSSVTCPTHHLNGDPKRPVGALRLHSDSGLLTLDSRSHLEQESVSCQVPIVLRQPNIHPTYIRSLVKLLPVADVSFSLCPSAAATASFSLYWKGSCRCGSSGSSGSSTLLTVVSLD